MNILAKTLAAGALAFTGVAIAGAAHAQNVRKVPYDVQTEMRDAGDWRMMQNSGRYRYDDIRNRYNGFSQSTDGQGYIFN